MNIDAATAITPKRPRGRPRKREDEPRSPYTVTDAVIARQMAAAGARWCGRGESRTIRVDPDAARALARVPERDRRRVASDAIRAAVMDYMAEASQPTP